MIPEEAIRAASMASLGRYLNKATVQLMLEAAAPYMLAEVTKLVADLTDPDDCQFDHHGGCQAHGYLSLEPGEMCPQLEAKAWAFNHRPAE